MKPTLRVHYQGRLGNNLFQYAFGRLLAERLGGTLVAPPIDGFPRARARRFSLATLMRTPDVTLHGDSPGVAAPAVLKGARYVELRGYFQRIEHYQAHRERIARWFRRPEPAPLPAGSLTIHVRADDVWQGGGVGPPHPGYPALPLSYYRSILDERVWSHVYVVCQRADDPVAEQLLARPGVTWVTGHYLHDFDFIRRSASIALSVSTFGWWAAWLSRASTIYCPVAGIFDPRWSDPRPTAERSDLLPRADPRYRFQPVATPTLWQGDEENRRWVLSS